MVSRKNIKYKMQQDAKRVSHYGIRKLSIGVASVLLGTVFYMQNGTVHADVNPTVSTGNDSVNVVNKDSGSSGSAGVSSTSTDVGSANSGVGSANSTGSIVSTGDATNSTAPSQVSGSPVDGVTKPVEDTTNQVNNSDWAASEPESATPASQVNVGTDNSNSISSLPPASHHQPSAAGGNPINERLSANLSLSVNQKLNANISSLLASKVALTGVSNNAVNGGFDKATWGTLDVNAWKGSVQGNYYQLTDYTGDANHVIVPNEADFAKAGISTAGKQVGVTSDLMHRIFRDKTAAQDATVAFSKTDNKMVKAINADWKDTWNSQNNNRGDKLSRFDGTNLDVSNVTDMSYMFYNNRISDLSPLANWKVDNVTNMNWMFYNNQISDLSPLANWKVDNVTDMSWMFSNNHIDNLSPLVNWKVDNVTNMSNMFSSNHIRDLSPLANWKVDNVTNMNSMFFQNRISNLSSLANWKVDNVTNMGWMFYNNQISDLSPLANWKVDNVTNMSWMFYNNQISDLSPLANWKVDNVTNMRWMFYNNQISDLSSLANWKVNNVTDMSSMFFQNRISNLSPLANWKVDNVTDMSWMFYNNQISDLSPLANWKVDNVTDMSYMFYNNRISDLSPLANWKVDNVTNMSNMFYNNVTTQTKNLLAKRVINFAYPAGYAGKKQDHVTQTVDLPQKISVTLITKDFKPSNNILDWVTKTETPETSAPVYFKDYTVPAIKGLLEPDKTVITGQQADPTKPINVTVTYKLVESDTNDAFALDSKNGLHEHANVNDNGGYDTDFWGKLDVSKFTTVKNGDNLEITGYNGDASKVIIPNIADFEINNLDQGAKQVTISSQVMRKLAKNATRIGLSKTNNQKVVASDSDWSDAFGGLTVSPQIGVNGGMWVYNPNLTVMDLHNLDTTNITDMSSMFNGGSNLNVVGDLSQWNTANVVNMHAMFQDASSLTNIGGLNNWNVSNVTNMSNMFRNASALTNIGDLSKWDVSKVTDMSWMFYLVSALTNIGDLSNWDVSKVTDMSWMFYLVSALTNIGDLSKWDVSNVTNMSWMFYQASALNKLNISNWNLTTLGDKEHFQLFVTGDPNLVVIANNVKLPTWYQNELSNSNDFWNDHLAVITNNEALLKASGSVDNVTVDGASVNRPVFYNSNGSDDAVAVLKQANQAYVNQYQNEHPGYTLNLAADVDQIDPIALANAKFVSAPREVQFTIAYYDLTGKLIDSTTSTHKVGDTVSILPVAPDNYALANGQLGMNYLMRWGLNEVDFLVEPKLTTTAETKTVSRTIKVQTPDGQTNNVVQMVTFVRNGYLNQITKQITYSPWSFGGQYQFSGYHPKPMGGYTADVVPAVIVTPDSLNTKANVVYHKVPVVYEIDYKLANGTVVKNVSATPERDGTIHLTAPQGYRLLTTVTDVQVGHSSQKLTVLVLPDEQIYTAYSTLPSSVTEPLTKTITRTINITMPNGRVRRVVQQVHFVRTATVAANGKITYSNWTGVGQTSFDRLFVPKRRGYRLVMTDNQGQTLTGVNQMLVDSTMDDAVINVKYIK